MSFCGMNFSTTKWKKSRRYAAFFVTAVLFVVIYLGLRPAEAFAINVSVDGQPVDFAGQSPVSADGRTLVPVRGVFEMLGFDVEWNQAAQEITLTGRDVVVLTVGSDTFTVNGRTAGRLDIPVQIINERTMLPIRAVAESLGLHVGWNSFTDTVIVSSSPIPEPPVTRVTGENGELLDTLLLRVNGIEPSRPLDASFRNGRLWFDGAEFSEAFHVFSLHSARPPLPATDVCLFMLSE